MEIPEVYDGTVQIKAAVREGGERAKVAVASRDDAVDPVGACVGMKGTRINAVIRELKGEKIDIIEYSEDIVEYTMNALNPAKISKVLVAETAAKILEVIVPEDQLSLAIGKKGQNVRLASRLLGWQIDIKSEEEKKKEILSQIGNLELEQPEDPIEALPGTGEKTIARLKEAGISTIQVLASQNVEQLIQIPGIGEKTAPKLVAQAQAFLSGEEAGEEEAAGAEEADAFEEPELEEPQNQEPTDQE